MEQYPRLEEVIEPVDHHEVRGANGSARLSFHGRPGKVTHVVFGDSNIQRIANRCVLGYREYEEAISGLVLVHMPGGTGRFASLVKPITRLLHKTFSDSFADPDVRIQIAVYMGYNEPKATLKEYFRDCLKILMEFNHAYADVAATVEVQLGELLYGKSSLHSTSAQRNYVHNRGGFEQQPRFHPYGYRRGW